MRKTAVRAAITRAIRAGEEGPLITERKVPAEPQTDKETYIRSRNIRRERLLYRRVLFEKQIRFGKFGIRRRYGFDAEKFTAQVYEPLKQSRRKFENKSLDFVGRGDAGGGRS